MEVLEPLLAVPNPKKWNQKKKNKGKQGEDGPAMAAVIGSVAEANEAAAGPKGRLARSVRDLATPNTADGTAYTSGRALRPHLDEEPVPLLAESATGQMLSERTCRARSGRA
jgi:hypothetical protein